MTPWLWLRTHRSLAVFLPIALAMAVADVLLILVGTHRGFSRLLVWLPAVACLALAVAAFRGAAARADGAVRTFWRRLSLGMGAVLVAALSQILDISTAPYSGMPPIGVRTLLLYVVGSIIAMSALLRLPGGGRS